MFKRNCSSDFYERPEVNLLDLDCDGFICSSARQLGADINGHETGVDVDLSGSSLQSDWEEGSSTINL